jgi:hypothetical protein
MKAKTKKVLVILGGIVMSAFFLYSGYGEWRNSRRLAAEGRSTTGEVLEATDRRSGKFRRHTYFLRVQFAPEAGAATVAQKVEVSRDTFDAAVTTGVVKVHYLPDNPTTCVAGETVQVKYGKIVWGIVFLGAAVFLIIFFREAADEDEAREMIEESLRPLCEDQHNYAPVDARRFKHLDLAYYDDSQQTLETHGFRCVGDVENRTLNATSNSPRTFLRLMVNPNARTTAAMYHFKPGWMLRILKVKDAKAVDVETAFTDGSFVCTSNAESAGALNPPPQIDSLFMPAATAIETLVQAHQKRVAQHLAARPQVGARSAHSLEDVLRLQDEMQKIKAAYRRDHGLSKEELTRITGVSGDGIERVLPTPHSAQQLRQQSH